MLLQEQVQPSPVPVDSCPNNLISKGQKIEIEYITVFKTTLEIEDNDVGNLTKDEYMSLVNPEYDTEVDMKKRTIVSTKKI